MIETNAEYKIRSVLDRERKNKRKGRRTLMLYNKLKNMILKGLVWGPVEPMDDAEHAHDFMGVLVLFSQYGRVTCHWQCFNFTRR